MGCGALRATPGLVLVLYSYDLMLGRAPLGMGCRKPSYGASASVSALRASIPHACALRLPCLPGT